MPHHDELSWHHIYAGDAAISWLAASKPRGGEYCYSACAHPARVDREQRGVDWSRAPTLHPGLDSAMTPRRELGGCVYPPVTSSSRKSGWRRRVNSMAIPSSRWRTTRPVVLPMVIGAPISGR